MAHCSPPPKHITAQSLSGAVQHLYGHLPPCLEVQAQAGGSRVFPGSAELNIKAALFALSPHLLLHLFELGGRVSGSQPPPQPSCPWGAIGWVLTDACGTEPAQTHLHIHKVVNCTHIQYVKHKYLI